MNAPALLFAYAGFTALALAMNRHFQQVWHRLPRSRERLAMRAAGWLLVLASLATCMKSLGGGPGLVTWIGVLTAVLVVLAGLFAYRPKVAGLLACMAPLAALLLLAGD